MPVQQQWYRLFVVFFPPKKPPKGTSLVPSMKNKCTVVPSCCQTLLSLEWCRALAKVELHLLQLEGKNVRFFNRKKILCEYNIFHAFFQLLKINGIRKTGRKFCPYFLFSPRKSIEFLSVTPLGKVLLRAAVRAHLYKTKYVF